MKANRLNAIQSRRVISVILLMLVFATTLMLPRLGEAEPKCPWLNAATATGVMGGEVTMTVSDHPESSARSPTYIEGEPQRKDLADVSCKFTRSLDGLSYVLAIDVKTLADPAEGFTKELAGCRSKVAITGVGNEAFACRARDIDNDPRLTTDRVMSLVRNRMFILSIDHKPTTQSSPLKDGLRVETRNIAEQIAGSLF